ncbi:MAG: cell division protein FtsA [Chitinophagales bacterium]|jgi:cell division protein FtsA|nr:cell division protein FtsA [Chitinophagales bacterium]
MNKNPQDNLIVSLDVGTTKICVIAAQRHEQDKIEILAMSSVVSRGVRRGEVVNILLASQDIAQAVQKVEAKLGFKISSVYVGLASAHIISRTTRVNISRDNPDELITKDDLYRLSLETERIALNPGEEILQKQHQEYFVDDQEPIKNMPIGMTGSQLSANYHLIIGNKKSTANIEKALQMAGLTCENYNLEPLASARAVLTQDQMDQGVCLVDIGGGTTDIAIFYKGLLRHTAIIPKAGASITESISDQFKISPKYAEHLKTRKDIVNLLYASVKDITLTIKQENGLPSIDIGTQTLSKFIHKCYFAIFSEVKKEIHNSFFKDKLGAGIIVTGGGAMVEGMKLFLNIHTGYESQIGNPIRYIHNLKDQSLNSSIYSTSIGLALCALSDIEEKEFIANRNNPKPIVNNAVETHLEKQDSPSVDSDTTSKEETRGIFSFVKRSLQEVLIDKTNYDDFEK